MRNKCDICNKYKLCCGDKYERAFLREFYQIPLFLNGTRKLFTSCLYLLNRSQNKYKISNKMPHTHKLTNTRGKIQILGFWS